MTFGSLTTRDQVKRQRAQQPHRTHATIHARPETLREALAKSGGVGVGLVAPNQVSVYPFDNQAEYDRYSALYDTAAMGRIARALREPQVRALMTHDTGTAPELHIVGKFLQIGWAIQRDIIFQTTSLVGFRRRHRVFVADVALRFGGRFVLVPVDGEHFHDRLRVQREDDLRRNAALGRMGQVCAVPSRYCFEAATLDSYLQQRLGVSV